MREETILNAINDLDSINCMIQDIHESIYQDSPDYWTLLEHQAAIAAMQGLMTILPNIGGLEGRTPKDEIIDIATETAHALVEKMKEERK